MGFTSGNSTRSCTLTVSAGRSAGSAAPQPEHWPGRCSTTASGVSHITRLWPSCPGLAPPGFERSRCSLRSVEGGLEEVREVFSGRCRRSTSSTSSSLLRRSSSPRPIPPLNQQKRPTSRAWVIADFVYPLAERHLAEGWELRSEIEQWCDKYLNNSRVEDYIYAFDYDDSAAGSGDDPDDLYVLLIECADQSDLTAFEG